MATRLRTAIVLIAFLIFASANSPSQGQLQVNYYSQRIEIHEDGSAKWIIEQRFFFKTQDDVAKFLNYSSTNNQTLLDEFTASTRWLAERASVITSRSMETKNFQISAIVLGNAQGQYGVIKRQCDWTNFVKIEGQKIILGDVFFWGIHLYQNEEFVVQFPQNFIVEMTNPEPDATISSDRTVVWYGPKIFGAGEPTAIFGRKTESIFDVLQRYFVFILALFVASFSFAGIWFLRRSRREKAIFDQTLHSVPSFISDKPRVISLLKTSGGQMYQSDITAKCGFSKSKTSQLMAEMEAKGLIKRQKKGRERLVTLEEKGSNQKL